VAHRGQLCFQRGEHPQADSDLRLPGRREVLARQGGELPGPVSLAQTLERRGALVEQGRVDALDPRGVLGPQVVVALQQCPALHDVLRRDPAFREPALGEQVTQQPRIRPVRFGTLLAPAGGRGVRRLR